VVCYLRS